MPSPLPVEQALPWYLEPTINALRDLWQGFLVFIPQLLGALVTIGIGWIVAAAFGKLIAEFLKKLKFNQLFERGGWKEALEHADLKVDAAGFVGAIFKWILVFVFLLAAVEILGFVEFARFLQGVVDYLPNVVVAVLIFAVTVVVVDIVEKLVRAAVGGAKIGYARLAGSIARWAIWVFAILAILRQLWIVPQLIDVLFTALVYGVVLFLVLAFGLSFGLGGRDVAAGMLQDLRRKLKGE